MSSPGYFFFSSRRRHTRFDCDWSSDVCSSDDVVHVTRRGHDVLIGRGHEISRHYMEIRGVGLIDINALFGIRSVRQQKRIEVVVELEDWDNTREYDRTGLDQKQTELLDVSL